MNDTQGEEKIMFPSLDELRQLYDAAEGFRGVTPWNWMWDSDIFGVQNPEDGETGYCCVLGRNREVFGLNVYLGSEGLEGYLKVVSGKIRIKDPDALHIHRCLSLSFEDRERLSKYDISSIKQLGLKFRGENAWPKFASYQPGFLPWRLTRDEAVYLTICLQQAREVLLRFKESPDMLKPPKANQYFNRAVKKKEDIFEWYDAWLEPAPFHKIVIMRQAIDEKRLERLIQTAVRQNLTWEIDFFYAPAYIAEKGKRPYFPLVLLWVDKDSYFIFFVHVTTPKMYRVEFIEKCLLAFESAKILPKEIEVRKKELLSYLQPLSQQLGIDIKLVKRLKAVDEARKGMREFFGRKN
jgi:hypothetical protein